MRKIERERTNHFDFGHRADRWSQPDTTGALELYLRQQEKPKQPSKSPKK